MDYATDKGHRNLLNHGLLQPDEERYLLRDVARAPTRRRRDRAAGRLAASNMRLVDSVARKYFPPGTMSHEDLFEAGCEGLYRAIRKFDPDRGVKFSTYATYWIRQAIARELENYSRPIRLPAHLHQKIARAIRTASDLSLTSGHAPSKEELADHLGVTVQDVDSYHNVRKRCSETRSMNSPITEDGREFAEVMPDGAKCAEDHLPHLFDEQTSDALLLHQALDTLSETERHIVRARYGLDGKEPKTLAYLSKELGISAERVRQRQLNATDKLYRKLVAAKSRGSRGSRGRAPEKLG